ncbi:MAG: carboxypeptidase-like regulatory domain-containing protein [Bacteroidota bacterium]
MTHFLRLHFLQFLLFTLISAVPVTAQSPCVVTGIVSDATTNTPIPGATLAETSRAWGAITNSAGAYCLQGVAAGEYTIIASALGFTSLGQAISIQVGTSKTLNFSLQPAIEQLGEITIEAAGRLAGGPGGVRDIPGSVSILGPETIRRFGDSDLHRMLAEVPGISVQEEDGYGLRPNIGIRGTVTDRSRGITIMEDGVLVAPAPYAAPAAYYITPAARLDGLEVRKGSSQIAYGPYTTGGALNFVSVRIPSTLNMRVDLKSGTDAARMILARFGQGGIQLGRYHVGFVLEGLTDQVDGFKQLTRFTETGQESLEGNTGYNLWSVLGKFRISRVSNNNVFHSLELKGVVDGQQSNETYLGLTAADFDEAPFSRYEGSSLDRFDSSHNLYHLRYTGIWNNYWDVSATLYGTRFERDWFRVDAVKDGREDDEDLNSDGILDTDLAIPINRLLADPVLYQQELSIVRGETIGTDGAIIIHSNDRKHNVRGLEVVAGWRAPLQRTISEVRAGLRLHRDRADRLQRPDLYQATREGIVLEQLGVPGNAGNRIDRAEALAAFIEFKLSIADLTVTSGARLEHIIQEREDYGLDNPNRNEAPISRNNTTTTLIPGIGLHYALSQQTAVFGGLHRGFAPATSTPGVSPENSINTELGLRSTLEHLLNVQAVVFNSWYSNLIGADFASSGGTGTGDLFNGGEAMVQGIEVSVGFQHAWRENNQLSSPLRFVYSYTDASFKSNFISSFLPWGNVRNGDKIPYVVPHSVAVVGGLESNLFQISLRTAWSAETRDRAGQGAILEDERVDSKFIIDLSTRLRVPIGRLTDHIQLIFDVRNLTNARYVASRRPAGLRPGLPRKIFFGLRVEI